MVFDRIRGQEPAVSILTRALELGRVHHAYRFQGPRGVGKELAAFALAQSLLCESGGAIGCGSCSACRRAVHFTEEAPQVPLHPDLVVVQRGLYPPSLLGSSSRETTGIGVDQIRRIVISRMGYGPHEGRALVVIVRDAHELTAQAANAMLKTLEEPGPGVHFILITDRPNRLLDTVRSRTLAVRFGPLPQSVIEQILQSRGLPPRVAEHAQGSAALALELADEEHLKAREAFADAALAAAEAPHVAAAVDLAAAQPSDRDALREQLVFLGSRLAAEARRHAADGAVAERAARRHELVLDALGNLDRNAQPALVLESMLSRMRRV